MQNLIDPLRLGTVGGTLGNHRRHPASEALGASSCRPHVPLTVPSIPAPPRSRAYQKDPAPCDALTTRGSLAGLTKKSLGFPPPRRVSYICLVGPRLRIIHPNSAVLFSLANSPHIHDKCHPRLGHSLHAIHQTVTPGLSCKILSGWQPKISHDV